MSDFQKARPPSQVLKDRMADTPFSLDPPNLASSRKQGKLKKSIYYGILLYILSEYSESLSEEQKAWIVYYSRKLSVEQLLKAVNFQELLRSSEITRRRTQIEINRIRIRIPRLEQLRLPEARRIGIGYRDKGALRPLHLKRDLGERAFWDEDIEYLLPFDYLVEGKWITADEVSNLIGINLLELVLRQTS